MNRKLQKNKSRDSQLEEQGWIRQFVADEPRLSEAVELYEKLGYDVKLEPAVFDEQSEECKECLLAQDRRKYKIIYIRPKNEGESRVIFP
jgi:DNA-directed RNA polymerase subunit F